MGKVERLEKENREKTEALQKIKTLECFDVPFHGTSFVGCLCRDAGVESVLARYPKRGDK